MKNLSLTLAILLLAPLAGLAAADATLQRATFREVDTLFANPGQGWMSQQRSPRGEPRCRRRNELVWR